MPINGVLQEAALVILKNFAAPPPGKRPGGKAGTRRQRSPFHPLPYFKNPNSHPNHFCNSQPVTFLFKANLAESTGKVQRWGLGSWAVKQANPTQLLWRPASPLGCEGGRSARPSQKVGGVWVMDGYWRSRPGYLASSVYTLPQTPPRLHPAPDFRTSHQEIWCRMRQARRGFGCQPFRWAGMRFFCRLNPARLGAVALGVASEEAVYCPKMDGWLQWWLWRELMWFKMAPPSQKPAARRTLTSVLRHKKSLLEIAIFIFN